MHESLKPVIILVNPQLAENIGMSARAMFNCGIEELRLVNPIPRWPNERSMVTSADSLKLMPEVKIFDNLGKATFDLQYLYASTARPRGFNMDIISPSKAGKDMVRRIVKYSQKVGIVFGKESSGLDNADISKCNIIVTVPLNDRFSSLNLSQAVLLLSWEWRKFSNENILPKKLKTSSLLASKNHIDELLDKLEYELNIRGFFKSGDSYSVVKRNLHAMFNRISMSKQEVQMMHGIIRTLSKFYIKK